MHTPTNGESKIVESLTRHETESAVEYAARVEDTLARSVSGEIEITTVALSHVAAETARVALETEAMRGTDEQHDELALAAAQIGTDIESLKSYTDRVGEREREREREREHEAEAGCGVVKRHDSQIDHEVDVSVTVTPVLPPTPIKGLDGQELPPIKMAPVSITVADSVHIDDVPRPRPSLTRKWDPAALVEKARRR